MNVNIVAVGEVVVDDKVDTLEVHATTHDVRAYQNPHGARPKATDHSVTLHTYIYIYHAGGWNALHRANNSTKPKKHPPSVPNHQNIQQIIIC